MLKQLIIREVDIFARDPVSQEIKETISFKMSHLNK